MANPQIAKNPKAAAILHQIGTPARSRKPDETCPMALTARTMALSRPAALSETLCTDVSSNGSANVSEKIWHEYARNANARIRQLGWRTTAMTSEKNEPSGSRAVAGIAGAYIASM